jgi:hypothetical protein
MIFDTFSFLKETTNRVFTSRSTIITIERSSVHPPAWIQTASIALMPTQVTVSHVTQPRLSTPSNKAYASPPRPNRKAFSLSKTLSLAFSMLSLVTTIVPRAMQLSHVSHVMQGSHTMYKISDVNVLVDYMKEMGCALMGP